MDKSVACPQEAELWDETTFFEGNPSNDAEEQTPVVGQLTAYPIGFEFSELAYLKANAKHFKLEIDYDEISWGYNEIIIPNEWERLSNYNQSVDYSSNDFDIPFGHEEDPPEDSGANSFAFWYGETHPYTEIEEQYWGLNRVLTDPYYVEYPELLICYPYVRTIEWEQRNIYGDILIDFDSVRVCEGLYYPKIIVTIYSLTEGGYEIPTTTEIKEWMLTGVEASMPPPFGMKRYPGALTIFGYPVDVYASDESAPTDGTEEDSGKYANGVLINSFDLSVIEYWEI